jgi:NADH-quinone oxidoreductase subunit A
VPILFLAACSAPASRSSRSAPALSPGPKRYNRAKLDAYECGIEPTPQPIGGGRFPIKYYLTAMLFIVFDIEIVFLYPWASRSTGSACSGWSRWCCSSLTVFVAYAYVWRRGGLEWD